MTKICIQMEILLVILLRVLQGFCCGHCIHVFTNVLVPTDQIYGQNLTININCKDALHFLLNKDT